MHTPVSCANPWLHTRPPDLGTHVFDLSAFKWQQPSAHHDGRLCLNTVGTLVDGKCGHPKGVLYADYLRHLDLLNRTGHADAAAAHGGNTIGFEQALQPAFESTTAVEPHLLSVEMAAVAQTGGAAINDTAAVTAAADAFAHILQHAENLQTRAATSGAQGSGIASLPVLFFGLTGDSDGASALAVTCHLWPFYKVRCSLACSVTHTRLREWREASSTILSKQLACSFGQAAWRTSLDTQSSLLPV